MKSKVQAGEMRVLRLIKGVTRRRIRSEDTAAERGVKGDTAIRGDSAFEMVRTC